MALSELNQGQVLGFPLPKELLTKVFSLLEESDLSSMARVSRQYRDYFQPILFSNVSIQYTYGSPKSGTLKASLLLRTMLRRSDLALACESLYLDVCYSSSPHAERANLPPLLDERDLTAIRRLVQRIRPHALEPWCAAIQSGNIDAVVALILCCVTHLRKLRLIMDTFSKHDYIKDLLTDMAHSKRQCPIFDELREATFHHQAHFAYEDGRSPCDGEYWAFFQLAELKSLNVCMYETRSVVKQIQARPMGNNLRSLVLGKKSCITGQTLGQILRQTPKLEVLVYDFNYYIPTDPRIAYLRSNEIGTALQYVKHTLRHLHLSTKFDEYDYHDDDGKSNGTDEYGFLGRLGSLNDFHTLETLEVPLVVILGWKPPSDVYLRDCLPRSLTHFICRNDSVQWHDWSWDHHEHAGHIHFHKDYGFPYQTFRQLSSLFEASGHELQLEELTLLVKDMEDPEVMWRWPAWPWTPEFMAALRKIAGDTKISYHECKTRTCDAPMCVRWHTYISELYDPT